MRTMFKYPLSLSDGLQRVNMPKGALISHVHWQGCPTMWAEVETDNEKVERVFVVRGTGFQVDPPEAYVGTCHQPPFVWHIFEVEL